MKNVFVVCSVFAIFLSACSQKPAGDQQKAWTLPGTVSEGSCGPQPLALDLCTWAASTDALVWGTVLDVQLVDSPLMLNTDALGHWKMISSEECESQLIGPALELRLEVKQSMWGELSGTVVVRMGYSETGHLEPLPKRAHDGSIEWISTSTEPGVGPLVEGQPLGVALYHVEEYGMWSLLWEPLFSQGEDGRIFVRKGIGECALPPPQNLAGSAPDDLATVIRSCQVTPEAEARRDRIRECITAPYVGCPPSLYWAAYCFPEGNGSLPPGSCTDDADCPAGESCVNGKCTAS